MWTLRSIAPRTPAATGFNSIPTNLTRRSSNASRWRAICAWRWITIQPIVEIATGKIVGLEALTRWNHPKFGQLIPGRFIPLAEKTGLIIPLGEWLTAQVCRQIAQWRTEGLNVPLVAMNVSAAQLVAREASFDRMLMQNLHEHSVPVGSIEIELTESVLMETTLDHTDIIEHLRNIDVPIAIDDFGTGYSSLNYLRSYRVNHIKIAQEFVRDLESDPSDIVIVRAALGLARELGIKVVAEGVETAYQRDALAKAGCQYVQGFYFSRPVPAARAAELLRKKVIEPLAKRGQQ